uniref:Ion_trans_2 domain-containing protein n=1 Tax=Syphacia muris TaxID=451379 RepID=A0A0N5AK40_9BILA
MYSKKRPTDTYNINFRIVLPHVGLVILSAAYTLLGAAIFHHLEVPSEIEIRNRTSQQIDYLKQRLINDLLQIVQSQNVSADNIYDRFSATTVTGYIYDLFSWIILLWFRINTIIRNVSVAYTKNYMTADDIIEGDGPIKWSFSSSVFFSWTAITTIGYGHIVPRTPEGRVACLLYTLLGVPLILVTIADMGRFLSARLRAEGLKTCSRFFRAVWCCICVRLRKNKHQSKKSTSGADLLSTQRKLLRRRRANHIDNLSDAGTFEGISEIHSQDDAETSTADTHARADDLEGFEGFQTERRVSVLFVLVIMIGYTAGGAFLMKLWENWEFMDSFYFCFVTVTTIGFGDIVPQNVDLFPATLAYIIFGLIITTMCIDLVGSAYIHDIHFYGRTIGKRFMTIGGKVVHLGEVFGYIAFLQKNYGLTPEQLDKLSKLPEQYLLDCMISGKQPDMNRLGIRPYVPPDIYFFKWIEHPRTLSLASERVMASMESLDLNTSRCSTARTLTPREYYQKILLQYCKQVQPDDLPALDANETNDSPEA